MIWIFLLAIVLVVVAFVILLTGKRSNPYLFNHVSAFARSAGANIVPTGYCVAMAFFLTLFDSKFLVHTNYSIAHKSFIKLCYFLPFISFAILYFSDPGQITKQNHRELTSMFPYDRILYSPFVECRTCLFTKPARSKHCSVCKSCVAFHDHHCIWVNNCVGLWNFRWFMLFLVVNMYVFVYGFFLLLIPLIPSIKTVLTHKWKAFGYLINLGEFERVGACLLLLCTFLFPLVLAFSYFHLHYLWAGVTTNEADKWEDIYVLISLQVLYIYEDTNTVLMKKKDGNFNRKPTHAEEQHIKALNSQLKLVESVAELPNIYDLGTKANIMQRIFPKSSTNKIEYVV